MEVTVRPKVRGTPGCELLRSISPVDPRAAEGLRRQPAPGSAPATMKEMDALLEEERRLSIKDTYQRLLFEVKAMQKKGNFRASQGDVIVQRVRDLSATGCTTLDLSGFIIFDAFAELLSPFLQSQTCKLVHMNLSGTQIGIDGAVEIAKAVNPVLETLQFSRNALDVIQFRWSGSGNKHLSIGRKQFNHLDAVVVGVLLDRVRGKVENVDLSGNLLTGPSANVFHGISLIFQTLKRCSQLRTLKLDDDNLRADGLVELANTIKDLKLLEALVLSSNKLAFNSSDDKRSTGIEAFCNSLWQAQSLIHLSLADNYLDYASGNLIADMLAINAKLKQLDLSGNPLLDAGAVLLSAGLKKNASLESLSLARCGLGVEGIQTLCSVLRRFNRTLRLLDLRENAEMSSTSYRSIIKCLTVNPTLCEIPTSPMRKHFKCTKRVEELLQVNTILAALRKADKKAFEDLVLSDGQCTNLIQKLHEFSEADFEHLNDSQLLGTIVSVIERAISSERSSIAHYAATDQLTPLRALLWVLESNKRREGRDQRSSNPRPRSRPRSRCQYDNGCGELDEDEDIWDYPLS